MVEEELVGEVVPNQRVPPAVSLRGHITMDKSGPTAAVFPSTAAAVGPVTWQSAASLLRLVGRSRLLTKVTGTVENKQPRGLGEDRTYLFGLCRPLTALSSPSIFIASAFLVLPLVLAISY